ncbi:MAG TPA: substrate-binding domain-containing protein [Tardiphaga sp.]
MTVDTGSRITLLTAIAVQSEIEELIPRFTRLHEIEVDVNYDVNPAVAKRVMAGEKFDVGLTNPWYVDEMIALERVIPNIHVPFGRVPLAIGAIGSGSMDIVTSHEAVRAMLLEATSIAYTSIGTSGKTFLRAIETMGIETHLRDRLRPMGASEPSIAAAAGKVQYAIAPLSRIIAAPGIVPVATFPRELGLNIDMSMFISHGTGKHEPAMQLIRFFADPDLDAYFTSHGISRYAL